MMEELSSQEETLQKLERLTHLETVVAEQRIRIEKYRTMYETLKTEHVQVEDVRSYLSPSVFVQKDLEIFGLIFQALVIKITNIYTLQLKENNLFNYLILAPIQVFLTFYIFYLKMIGDMLDLFDLLDASRQHQQ